LPVFTGRGALAAGRGATFFAAAFSAGAGFVAVFFVVAAGIGFFGLAGALALIARPRCVVFFVAIVSVLLVGADIALTGDRSRDLGLQG